jgi:hypothetical protein
MQVKSSAYHSIYRNEGSRVDPQTSRLYKLRSPVMDGVAERIKDEEYTT